MADKPDYYAIFLNALEGLIDDAEMSGYDSDGIGHLREASEFFRSEYRIQQHVNEQEALRGPGKG